MPDDRTTLTELGTALGTLSFDDPLGALCARPPELGIGPEVWEHLDAVVASGRFATELTGAFANGRAFLEAAEGLRHRPPMTIEWTGGRRAPGDEVAPIDLRIDHVYLVSCKYESDIVANSSPARLFEGLLATSGTWERGDWYAAVAPDEYVALYRSCVCAVGLEGHPDTPDACTREQLATLRAELPGRSYPDAHSRAAYVDLCRAVSTASAARWAEHLTAAPARETMLWRLLRIGSAPYFVLGNDRATGAPVRYRVVDPWDWRDRFDLRSFSVAPAEAGQPRVDWSCTYRARGEGTDKSASGHVEIRWSHGRFAGPPEAKVYLDTPMARLPGYHPLVAAEEPQLTLFPSLP